MAGRPLLEFPRDLTGLTAAHGVALPAPLLRFEITRHLAQPMQRRRTDGCEVQKPPEVLACFLSGIRQRPDSRVIEGLARLACLLEPALDHRAHVLQRRIEALPRLINGGFKLETSSGWFPLRKTGAAKCQLQQRVNEGVAVEIWAGAQQQRDGTADRLGQITRLTLQDRSREAHGAVLPRPLCFLGRPLVLNVQPRHAFLERWKHGNRALLQRQSLNLR